MIEDMTVRGFNEHSRRDYVCHVRSFAAFIGRSPDTATAEDLRLIQLHQTQIDMQPPSINSAVPALRFFFTVTFDRPDLARRLTVVPQPRRIAAVLSVEEVTLLLRATSAPKYKAAFATTGACPRVGQRPDPWGAGLRVSEVVALKVGDVDSERMLLRVERGKGRKGLPSRKRGPRDAVAEAARTAARLVAGGAAAQPAAVRRNQAEPLSARERYGIPSAGAILVLPTIWRISVVGGGLVG
jgi:integrase